MSTSQEEETTPMAEAATAEAPARRGGRPRSNGQANGTANASNVQPANEETKTTWSLAEVAAIRAEHEEREMALQGELEAAKEQLKEATMVAGEYMIIQRRMKAMGVDF